uniref:Secreted protein n=1 Tax=Eutreptiella gymnastica TaxID=73025 RepID=A0A7S4FSY4_9EUGL
MLSVCVVRCAHGALLFFVGSDRSSSVSPTGTENVTHCYSLVQPVKCCTGGVLSMETKSVPHSVEHAAMGIAAADPCLISASHSTPWSSAENNILCTATTNPAWFG